MKIGDHVILTGDNFQVPDVGIRGIVARVGFHGYILVEWRDGARGWFSPYQASKWIAKTSPPPVPAKSMPGA